MLGYVNPRLPFLSHLVSQLTLIRDLACASQLGLYSSGPAWPHCGLFYVMESFSHNPTVVLQSTALTAT